MLENNRGGVYGQHDDPLGIHREWGHPYLQYTSKQHALNRMNTGLHNNNNSVTQQFIKDQGLPFSEDRRERSYSWYRHDL